MVLYRREMKVCSIMISFSMSEVEPGTRKPISMTSHHMESDLMML